VLPDLTRYLLLYKRLCIPHVGTFEIVQQAPEYTVVDKLIHPPKFSVRHFPGEQMTEHQLEYFAAQSYNNKEAASHQLNALGNRIKTLAENKAFTWNGIGALRFSSGTINFENQFSTVEGFDSVTAHKVLRENVEHSRLVGDTQTTTLQTSKSFVNRKWALPMRWGWIILGISILTIIIILFLYNFSPFGAGLKLKFF
jgi:hypothetical protein